MKRIFTTLILGSLLLPVMADDYRIRLSGEELKKLTAFEIKLSYDPPKTFSIKEDFKVLCDGKEAEVLYKVVDTSHSFIRVFFSEAVLEDELVLEGQLERMNYSGDIDVEIFSKNYVADFATDVDVEKIKTELEVTRNENELPYMGISKAELLGPEERIFTEDMFISIGNIETYGFDLDSKISSVKINGEEAKIINGQIIAAHLPLERDSINDELPIKLELSVDNERITKELGFLRIVK